MRRDVHKVVSERPKSGRTWESKTPRKKAVVLDVLGDQIGERANSLRPKHQKYRQARLNVLERFLINRVGRAWDKVYAEACTVADSRSFGGAEIRDSLKRLVAVDCWLEGRIVMSHDWRGCPQAVKGLYVNPKSRVLLRTEPLPRS